MSVVATDIVILEGILAVWHNLVDSLPSFQNWTHHKSWHDSV